MKFSSNHWYGFRAVLMAMAFCAVTSCDKVSNLTDKVSGLWSDSSEKSSASVSDVDEKEGKSIIAEESRIVLVEFYSDT